jgi:alpha-glucosidase
MLALPGSAYLYQGEELGLHDVPNIPGDQVQDPVFSRSRGAEKGRDGCRVPLPGGTLLLASVPPEGGQLPADATAWLITG